ncbi:MAG: ribosome-binding factor A [Myxococcales bacterium]|nr:ribosome-binding factor A [Myxococcales bacterium]
MRRQPTFTRADRLEHLMADEVERLLAYEARSPLVRHVKVVHAELSGDLGFLRVQYIVQPGGEATPELQEALERSASWVGRTLAESLQLRKAVDVAFRFDREAMRLHKVQALLAAEAARAADRVTVSVGPDLDAVLSGPGTGTAADTGADGET